MVSLKESWQQQRKQRQQEVVQRQQIVRDQLIQWGQTRQVQAIAVRQDLQAFQQRLKQQTQELIAVCAADRAVMAQQVRQDLNVFRTQLSETVAGLRQELQTEVQQRKSDIAEQLQYYQQARLQKHLQLMQELAAYLESVRVETRELLAEFGVARQLQAEEVRQMLQESTDRRKAEVAELFAEFAIFRQELVDYCADLRRYVWGEELSLPPQAEPTVAVPEKPAAKAAAKPAAKPALKPSPVKPTPVSPTPVNSTAVPAAPVKPASSEPAPVAVVSNGKVAAFVQKPPAANASLTEADSVPIARVIQPSASDEEYSEEFNFDTPAYSNPLEEAIYTHIYESQGARLAEIESALGLNRFQTVDTLRTLIRKGLITQRNSIYLIQEDVTP